MVKTMPRKIGMGGEMLEKDVSFLKQTTRAIKEGEGMNAETIQRFKKVLYICNTLSLKILPMRILKQQ